jgi:hypothetical protein
MGAGGYLADGDWRGALAVPRTRSARQDYVAGRLAWSMRHRAFGMVDRSWGLLVEAAAGCPQKSEGPVRSRRAPLFQWPADHLDEGWTLLIHIGRREEAEIRDQRERIISADGRTAKQQAVVEAWVDHLTWVEFDPWTWLRPIRSELLPHDRVTFEHFGETGRDYLVRRAKVAFQFAHAGNGQVTRRVWDGMDGFRATKRLALRQLAESPLPPVTGPVELRKGYTLAVAFARSMTLDSS